jgi:large subunit ribosomal protein L22
MATTTSIPAARASVRYLKVSPYKVRQVLTLVRGLPVDDAERALQMCRKDAANHVQKLLASAIANAEHNHALEADELYVASAWADEGPTQKRGQARARGRYFRIRNRTSHVTIMLERFDAEELEERRRLEEATGRGAAVAQRRRAERVRRSRAVDAEAEGEAAEVEAEEIEAAEAPEQEVEAPEAAVEPEVEAEAEADEPEGPSSPEGASTERPEGASTERPEGASTERPEGRE